MHPNFHLSYGILVRKYKNVTITSQQERENPLKIRFCFQTGIKSLSMCLPVGIAIVPPSASGYTEVLQGGIIPRVDT